MVAGISEPSFAGSRALVLGLGVSGVEVARILASRGASVLASDASDRQVDLPGVEIEVGSHDRARAELSSFDFVFASPGISPLRGFLAEVIDHGPPVTSELELAVALSDAPVVAVTGTNGKTTVCRLAEAIGRQGGLDVYACGNLETKFITAADEHPGADAFVVEASSFSLAFCRTFHPRVAVVTNLAPDHLDWHGTFEHYREAKALIAKRQVAGELYLFPADQPELEDFAPADGPTRVGFSDSQVRAGAAAIASRGKHFAADANAAATAMAFLGVGDDAAQRAFEGFSFDRHRLEAVGTKDGVRYVDDSVATNTHATLAAIASFDDPVVLIAGGRNKGIDLGPLGAVAGKLRAVVAVGEAAPQVAAVFDGRDVFVGIASSIEEAVAMATERAKTGDVVLLSPACASHDMFNNYAERGEAFIAACRKAGVGA